MDRGGRAGTRRGAGGKAEEEEKEDTHALISLLKKVETQQDGLHGSRWASSSIHL